MKHLLILLISILLLSSLLISCDKKEEILYGWKTSSGEEILYEWKEIGDKDNNPQYKGEVKREYIIFGDYIIEGLGSLTFPDGEKYVGEYKDGSYHGHGTFTTPDGRKMVGEFREGQGWNVIGYDKNGNENIKWVKGKIESTQFGDNHEEVTLYRWNKTLWTSRLPDSQEDIWMEFGEKYFKKLEHERVSQE